MTGNRPPRPPRTVAVRVVIAVVVLVGATVLFGGGIAALLTSRRNDQAREALDDYFAALESQDYAEAYRMRCNSRRADQDEAEFEREHREKFGTIESHSMTTYEGPGLFGESADAIVSVKMSNTTGPPARSELVELALQGYDDTWKVCSTSV